MTPDRLPENLPGGWEYQGGLNQGLCKKRQVWRKRGQSTHSRSLGNDAWATLSTMAARMDSA